MNPNSQAALLSVERIGNLIPFPFLIDALLRVCASEETIESEVLFQKVSILFKRFPTEFLETHLTSKLRTCSDDLMIISIAKIVRMIELFSNSVTSALVRKLKYDRSSMMWPIDTTLRFIALSQKIATSVQSIGLCYKKHRRLQIRRILVGLYGYIHQKYSSSNSVVDRVGSQAYFYRYSSTTSKILSAIEENPDAVYYSLR